MLYGGAEHKRSIQEHAQRRTKERLGKELDQELTSKILDRLTTHTGCKLLEPRTGPRGMYQKWLVYIDDHVPYTVVYWSSHKEIVTIWSEEVESMEIDKKLQRRIVNCILSKVSAERVTRVSADIERWRVWADRHDPKPMLVLFNTREVKVVQIENNR